MPLIKKEPVKKLPNSSGPVPIRGGPAPARGLTAPGSNARPSNARPSNARPSSTNHIAQTSTVDMSIHEGTRQSLQTLHLSISTGLNDLDKILGHGGLPLGHILLIEEEGNTDFASVLLRSYASQGIVHARLENKSAPTKVLVIGMSDTWIRELPGVFKDKKEKAKEKIEAQKSVIGELAESKAARSTGGNNNNMKIAWRYGATDAAEGNAHGTGDLAKISNDHFTSVFDFTSRIVPVPSPDEIKCIPLQPSDLLMRDIVDKIKAASLEAVSQKSVLRVVIPSILHPMIYSSDNATSHEVIRFMHQLHKISRKYPQNVSIVISISLALYPNREPLTKWIEHICDGVLHLEPRNDLFEVVGGTNAAAANRDGSVKKPYQGFIHIKKLPVFSERGHNVARHSENVFRVGKRSFDINEWTIPVEDAEEDKNTTQSLDY